MSPSVNDLPLQLDIAGLENWIFNTSPDTATDRLNASQSTSALQTPPPATHQAPPLAPAEPFIAPLNGNSSDSWPWNLSTATTPGPQQRPVFNQWNIQNGSTINQSLPAQIQPGYNNAAQFPEAQQLPPPATFVPQTNPARLPWPSPHQLPYISPAQLQGTRHAPSTAIPGFPLGITFGQEPGSTDPTQWAPSNTQSNGVDPGTVLRGPHTASTSTSGYPNVFQMPVTRPGNANSQASWPTQGLYYEAPPSLSSPLKSMSGISSLPTGQPLCAQGINPRIFFSSIPPQAVAASGHQGYTGSSSVYGSASDWEQGTSVTAVETDSPSGVKEESEQLPGPMSRRAAPKDIRDAHFPWVVDLSVIERATDLRATPDDLILLVNPARVRAGSRQRSLPADKKAARRAFARTFLKSEADFSAAWIGYLRIVVLSGRCEEQEATEAFARHYDGVHRLLREFDWSEALQCHFMWQTRHCQSATPGLDKWGRLSEEECGWAPKSPLAKLKAKRAREVSGSKRDQPKSGLAKRSRRVSAKLESSS